MKTVFILLLMLFSTAAPLFAQTTSEEKSVLAAALHIVPYKTPVVYIKNIRSQTREGLKKTISQLEKGKFYEADPYKDSILIDPVTGEATEYVRYVDSLILTTAEKQILINKYGSPVTWEDKLFDNSIGVKDIEAGYKAISSIKKDWKGNADRTYYYIFSFSRPIFIRNGTVCLIATGAMCGGDCGRVDISFYRKTGKGWKRWINIGGGEF